MNVGLVQSDMNLKIRSGAAGFNNKILVSERKFCLGKNDKVNILELAKEAIISKEGDSKLSHKDIKVIVQPTMTHEDF